MIHSPDTSDCAYLLRDHLKQIHERDFIYYKWEQGQVPDTLKGEKYTGAPGFQLTVKYTTMQLV